MFKRGGIILKDKCISKDVYKRQIYMCITFFLMHYVVNVYVVQSIDMIIFKIEDIIGIINEFSFYQIVVFGLSIYFMKDTDSKQ